MKSSWFLIILFIFLQMKLWIGKDGIMNLYALQKSIDFQNQKNTQLISHNQQLEHEIQSLKWVDTTQTLHSRNDSLTEDYARRKLGMIKKGEIFLIW